MFSLNVPTELWRMSETQRELDLIRPSDESLWRWSWTASDEPKTLKLELIFHELTHLRQVLFNADSTQTVNRVHDSRSGSGFKSCSSTGSLDPPLEGLVQVQESGRQIYKVGSRSHPNITNSFPYSKSGPDLFRCSTVPDVLQN